MMNGPIVYGAQAGISVHSALFKKSENNESLSGEYHGTQGHFVISDTRLKHPLTRPLSRRDRNWACLM